MKLVKIDNYIYEYDGRNYKYITKEVVYINIDYIVEIREEDKYNYPGSTIYEIILKNGSKLHINKDTLGEILNNTDNNRMVYIGKDK